jgi:hypothetical protein
VLVHEIQHFLGRLDGTGSSRASETEVVATEGAEGTQSTGPGPVGGITSLVSRSCMSVAWAVHDSRTRLPDRRRNVLTSSWLRTSSSTMPG